MRIRSALPVAVALLALLRGGLFADFDFEKTVQPIFERACVKCHGAEKQKGDLRLDLRAAAMQGGESGAAWVPGKSAESLLIQLVVGQDPDRIMPAKGERLSGAEIATLRAWIDAGAAWPEDGGKLADKKDWWSFQPLRAPRVPPSTAAHPIDAFLQPASGTVIPPANARTLLRRATFDLTGLPPTPEEAAAFFPDGQTTVSDVLYNALLDRLLASPRYGERWARHWMDVAHFAETHGHDQDRIREHAWPFRDYLIGAFNADKPYARFVQEQVAGDALFPDDPQATVALGFLAAGPWDESSLRDIREDSIDRQIGRYLDRDDVVATVMQTFTSTTVQCARCHDHKFDPISQREYYSLQAVFAGVDRANRTYDPDPAVHVRRRVLLAQKAALERRDPDALAAAVEAEATSLPPQITWSALIPQTFLSEEGATLQRAADDALLATGAVPEKDTYVITAQTDLAKITAVRLEVLTDETLPKKGPGRQPLNGNFHLSELRLLITTKDGGSQPLAIATASADFNQDSWTIAHALDGKDATAWGIHPEEGKHHEAVFELHEPLDVPAGQSLVVVLKQVHGDRHTIGKFRLSATATAAPVRAVPAAIGAVLRVPPAERTRVQRETLAAHGLWEKIVRELSTMPPPQLVYAAASDFAPDGGHKPAGAPRVVQMLKRGDIRQPLEVVAPGALGIMPAAFKFAGEATEATRRVALAQWLTAPENALTWRSIVNRVWHYHFGRGLVETPNDFGHMGSSPAHPELLDWLAVWFRDEARGSFKALHRLIMTSAAYRQRPGGVMVAANAIEPQPHLIFTRARQRLDAEQIRDALLAISGRLDLRMGGPSDRQFDLQPGIHVTPRVDYAKFDADQDTGRRRSVYRFLFRTLPDPLMDAFDCPAGDQLTPTRGTSITVQQTLALWNSSFTVRQAEHLAARIAKENSAVDSQIARLFSLVLNRLPQPEEAEAFAIYARTHNLASACRVLLNTDEFLFID